MSLSPAQIRLLQIAAGGGGANFSRDQYTTMLKNVAGVESSRDPAFTNEAFERCMALCEQHGFSDKCHGAGYWQAKFEDRAGKASHQQVHKLTEMASQTRYPLGAMARKFSGGRTDAVAELTPREAWNLIEAYKKILAREGQVGSGQSPVSSRVRTADRRPPTADPLLFPGVEGDSTADRTAPPAPPGLPDIPSARPAANRPRPTDEDVRQQRAQYADLPPDDEVPF